VITITQSGSYTVSVETQAVGCTDVSDTATTAEVLTTPEAIITSSQPKDSTFICSNDSVELSLVNSAFTIKWFSDTLNPIQVDTNVTNYTTFVQGQFFAVLINDGGSGNGCTDTSEVFIVKPLADATNLWSFDSVNSFCNKDRIALIGTNVGELLEFEWTTSGFGSIDDPSADTTFYIPAVSDSGLVSFEFSVSNQCITEGDIRIDTVTIRPSPDASYTPSALVVELNETVLFTVNNRNALIYDWVYQQGSSSSGFSGLHTYTQEGDYLSYLIATNEFNCADSFAVPIHVTRNELIYIPNVFSPNANNPDNQVMRVYGTNISSTDFQIVIYNRWGIQVFEETDLSLMKLNGWDGTIRETGVKLPSGVYTYYIKGKFFTGDPFQNVGTVSLIR
jgi:gliding motility-associated-like protein